MARQDEFQKQIQSMKPTQKYMLMGFEVQTCFVFFLGNSNLYLKKVVFFLTCLTLIKSPYKLKKHNFAN
jgi:hypothetical protein